MRPIGIISSRLTEERFPIREVRQVPTPWGEATVQLRQAAGRPVASILRFTKELTLPSHRINYRANLFALRKMGVQRIISQNAIGSINPALRPGDVVIAHDFIDGTVTRPVTMFDDDRCWVRIDMTEPFCPTVRQVLIEAATGAGGNVIPRGVFLCTEGPRFETPAEAARWRQHGVDIVGTPLVPEVIFARELEMCFASIAPIIDYGAGLGAPVLHVGSGSMVEFYYRLGGTHEVVERALLSAVEAMPEHRDCPCSRALQGAVAGQLPEWWAELE